MIYIVSTPPSVNSLYVNLKKGGRRKSDAYVNWISGNLKALIAQRAKPILSRAKVAITLPKTTRGDCDNRIKACLDLLVRAGILQDDRKAHLASVSASFGDDELCRVSVEPETKPAAGEAA